MDSKDNKKESARALSPYLSPLMVVALGFGLAVGWGSFVMPGTSFLPHAGPLGSLIALLLGGFAMSVFAINYHRMSLRNPGPGGAFTYAQKMFGEDHAFLTGWFLFLAYVSILWANATSVKLVVRYIFGDVIQIGFHYSLAGFDIYGGELLLTVLIIVLMGLLCMSGKRLAARFQTVVAIIFIVCVAVCFFGAINAHKGGLATMAPAFAGKRSSVIEVFGVLAMMPWAFVGFEAVTNSSSEFKFQPKKLLLLLLLSVGAGLFVYVALAMLPVLILPEGYNSWMEYLQAVPHLSGIDGMPTFCAARNTLGTAGVAVISAGMLCGALTGVVGAYVATSRLMYAMARDKLLPEWFVRLDSDGSPRNCIFFVMAISLIVPFCGRSVLAWPIDVASIGAAIAYGYTSAAAFKTFDSDPAEKSLAGKLLGGLGVVLSAFFCLLLLVPNYLTGSTLAAESYLLLALWCILGFLYYKYLFKSNVNGAIGESMIVWLSLIVLIIFSSLMWVRQSTVNSVRHIFGNIVSHDGAAVSSAFEADIASLKVSLLTDAAIELFLLVGAVIIMMGLYAILCRRERNMAAEKAHQEDINKAKSYFFSTVSHDIRTPLNAIIGFSQMLKEGFSTQQEQDQAIDSILLSGKTLLKLINDVLDLSKLESGRMEIEPEPTDCKSLVAEIAESFQISKKIENLEIRSRITDMPVLMLDPQRLRQISFNLLGNAVKFTKEGFIEIRASFSPAPDGKTGTFRLDVEDTGCGISEEDLKHISTPYVQVGSKSSRHGGTGLGLAITRQLATAMGGTMQVKSVLGSGTTFSIVLPEVKISTAPAAADGDASSPAHAQPGPAQHISSTHHRASNPAAKPADGDSPCRLLLVDDQNLNLMVLKAMLAKIDTYYIKTATNGVEALKILDENRGEPFDLVLTDMWMPEMDGESLVRAIRADPRFASLPVYVITADVETQKHYADIGFTGIILKPITLDRLKLLLK